MEDHSIFEAQTNPNIRNVFIESKIPFVVYIVSQTLGRYLETENDIEYLIGLEALNEAIDKYEAEKGGFETFAGIVIKNRVLDELRKGTRHRLHASYDDVSEVEAQETLDLKIELKEFSEKLQHYQLDFDKMVEHAPEHRDTRSRALKCARALSKVKVIVDEIRTKLKLPVALVVKQKIETRRFVYAHQRYILFSSLAYIYEFTQIIAWIESALGGEHDETL